MCSLERVHNLSRNRQRILEGTWTARDEIGERVTFDQLEDDAGRRLLRACRTSRVSYRR
jgi:hypothetical protein